MKKKASARYFESDNNKVGGGSTSSPVSDPVKIADVGSAGETIRSKLQKWKEKKKSGTILSKADSSADIKDSKNTGNSDEKRDFSGDKICFEPELKQEVSQKTLANRKAAERRKNRRKLAKLAAAANENDRTMVRTS